MLVLGDQTSIDWEPPAPSPEKEIPFVSRAPRNVYGPMCVRQFPKSRPGGLQNVWQHKMEENRTARSGEVLRSCANTYTSYSDSNTGVQKPEQVMASFGVTRSPSTPVGQKPLAQTESVVTAGHVAQLRQRFQLESSMSTASTHSQLSPRTWNNSSHKYRRSAKWEMSHPSPKMDPAMSSPLSRLSLKENICGSGHPALTGHESPTRLLRSGTRAKRGTPNRGRSPCCTAQRPRMTGGGGGHSTPKRCTLRHGTSPRSRPAAKPITGTRSLQEKMMQFSGKTAPVQTPLPPPPLWQDRPPAVLPGDAVYPLGSDRPPAVLPGDAVYALGSDRPPAVLPGDAVYALGSDRPPAVLPGDAVYPLGSDRPPAVLPGDAVYALGSALDRYGFDPATVSDQFGISAGRVESRRGSVQAGQGSASLFRFHPGGGSQVIGQCDVMVNASHNRVVETPISRSLDSSMVGRSSLSAYPDNRSPVDAPVFSCHQHSMSSGQSSLDHSSLYASRQRSTASSSPCLSVTDWSSGGVPALGRGEKLPRERKCTSLPPSPHSLRSGSTYASIEETLAAVRASAYSSHGQLKPCQCVPECKTPGGHARQAESDRRLSICMEDEAHISAIKAESWDSPLSNRARPPNYSWQRGSVSAEGDAHPQYRRPSHPIDSLTRSHLLSGACPQAGAYESGRPCSLQNLAVAGIAMSSVISPRLPPVVPSPAYRMTSNPQPRPQLQPLHHRSTKGHSKTKAGWSAVKSLCSKPRLLFSARSSVSSLPDSPCC